MSKKNRTQAKWERVYVMRETLARLFPEVIMGKHGNAKRPLKVGIYDDIVAYANAGYALDLADVRATLNVYCTSPNYLAVLVEGAVRIDLHGKPAGGVTKEAALAALRQVMIRNAPKELRAEVSAVAAENAMLKGAIQTARGCFAAAEIEGLREALAETTDERLKDLLQRRILCADETLSATGLEPSHV